MAKLIWTANMPFSMEDWAGLDIQKVAAGAGSVMVLTAGGEAFQKITSRHLAIREDYWYNLKDIALSKIFEGASIGLMNDGTCMIAKRFLRDYLRGQNRRDTDFYDINNTVSSWKDIVQVACSDAYFALSAQGHVYCAAFTPDHGDYFELRSWENVRKIVAGSSQHAIFGITRDGKVLCAGRNCTQGPQGDIRKKLTRFESVVDIINSGSEGGQIYLVLRDGSLCNLDGQVLRRDCATEGQCLEGHYWVPAVRLADGSLTPIDWSFTGFLSEITGWRNVCGFSLGNTGWDPPFALALTD